MSPSKPRTTARTIHNEPAGLVVLRPGWSQPGHELRVDWSQPSLASSLHCGPQAVWSGEWEWHVEFDGQPLTARTAWEEVAWVSDQEIAYLELRRRLSDGFHIERHVALARRDRFLLLADTIGGRRRGQISYRGRLPLGPEIRFRPARRTREGFLGTKQKPLALVLPLALPEWRADQQTGELAQEQQALVWSHQIEGRALFAPLWFDLNPRRMQQPCTWRQLTVAENRENQPRDVAAGFRAMVGKQQWLLYRALGRTANRTLLGHNLSTEMLLARFLTTGLVQRLVEIE